MGVLAFRGKYESEDSLQYKLIQELVNRENNLCNIRDLYKITEKHFPYNISGRNILNFTNRCLIILENKRYLQRYEEENVIMIKLLKPDMPDDNYKKLTIVKSATYKEPKKLNYEDEQLFKLNEQQIECIINNPYTQIILAWLQSSKEKEKSDSYERLYSITNQIIGHIEEINMEDTIEELIRLELVESYRKGKKLSLTLSKELHKEFPKGKDLYKLLIDYSENIVLRELEPVEND